mgnify:CR=1 FL=1
MTDPLAREAATRGVVTRTASGTVTTLPPTPLRTIPSAVMGFADGVADFGVRLALWVQQGASGRAVTDNTVFLVAIGLVAWAQGLVGAWGLFRRQDVVVAAVPTGIVLAVNHLPDHAAAVGGDAARGGLAATVAGEWGGIPYRAVL